MRQSESPAPPSALRRGLTIGLVVLGCSGVLLSTLAVWTHPVLLDTDRFVATVEPIVREPQVIAAVSERAGEEIVVALDLQRRAADALPDRARFLSAPLATAATNLIQERLESFLGRERVQSVLVAAIGTAFRHLAEGIKRHRVKDRRPCVVGGSIPVGAGTGKTHEPVR